MTDLIIIAVGAFIVGWLTRGWIATRRIREIREVSQARIDVIAGELALAKAELRRSGSPAATPATRNVTVRGGA